MKYVLYLYNGKDYGVTSLDMSVFNITNFTNISGIGSVSAFGTNLSREEFIAAVQAYNGGKSYSKLSNAAGDFYDICTSAEYNVNPCLAFAWACIETGYGKAHQEITFLALQYIMGKVQELHIALMVILLEILWMGS